MSDVLLAAATFVLSAVDWCGLFPRGEHADVLHEPPDSRIPAGISRHPGRPITVTRSRGFALRVLVFAASIGGPIEEVLIAMYGESICLKNEAIAPGDLYELGAPGDGLAGSVLLAVEPA